MLVVNYIKWVVITLEIMEHEDMTHAQKKHLTRLCRQLLLKWLEIAQPDYVRKSMDDLPF